MPDDQTRFDENAARITALERLFEQRFASSERALDAALTANDKRLDSMNEFRASIGDMTNKMMTRVEAINYLETASSKMETGLEVLRNKLEEASKPNYPLIIGVMSTVATLITGVWLIIGLRIDTAIAPTTTLLAENRTRIESTAQLQNTMLERISVIRTDISKLTAGQTEVETQFCASDIVRNLLHASDMRVVSVLWRKEFRDTPLPTDNAFYPVVCNRSPP
jgi:hypothetical protein